MIYSYDVRESIDLSFNTNVTHNTFDATAVTVMNKKGCEQNAQFKIVICNVDNFFFFFYSYDDQLLTVRVQQLQYLYVFLLRRTVMIIL